MPNLYLIEIPESVEQIDPECFNSCLHLEMYKCGIKHFKFLDLSKIKLLILNDEVVKICQADFYNLKNLQSLTLPDEI